MIRNHPLVAIVAAIVASVAAPVVAAGIADVINARHDGYRELGAFFKNVRDELRNPTPQSLILQMASRQIKTVTQQQYGWFPAGSGPSATVKTKALPAIWTNQAAFKSAQDAFAKQALVFNQAVTANDVAKIRVAAKSLGDACAACYMQFRAAAARNRLVCAVWRHCAWRVAGLS